MPRLDTVMRLKFNLLSTHFIILYVARSLCNDITPAIFGSTTNIMPAAFGDFNSDELTDLFVISDDNTEVQIYMGSTKEPYFETSKELSCVLPRGYSVTGVAPGDFDGNSLMDIMVTTRKQSEPNLSYVFIHWGERKSQDPINYYLNCTKEHILKTYDEPLVIDYRLNMITDLFGQDEYGAKVIWKFSKEKSKFTNHSLISELKLRLPHSHAFFDYNGDNSPDLFLTGENEYEIWLSDISISDPQFKRAETIAYPSLAMKKEWTMGQTLLLDLGTNNQILPVLPLFDDAHHSYIYVYISKTWHNLEVDFIDESNDEWGFGISTMRYRDTVTLRAADFNNDGYIDVLATLQKLTDPKKVKTVLLENIAYTGNNYVLKRTFKIRWNQFGTSSENAVLGTFFDFMQDGVMDIIFVHFVKGQYNISAYKNSLDYDANFIKVMVISEMTNSTIEMPQESLLGKKRFFGSNLPGPKVSYRTTTQDGNLQQGCSTQLPQSAHFALYLPYTIFGLGRTPNFVEDLIIGMFNQTKELTPIIPNSQLVIIIPDNAATSPFKWRAQLFVTPSKIVWQTVFALTGTCIVIALIIGVLHWKERRVDKLEKLQEAHRFHFDAM